MSPTGSNGHARRQPSGADRSLAEALRAKAARNETSASFRYQVLVGLGAFVGGLAMVVPAVLWLATQRAPQHMPKGLTPASLSTATIAETGPPALIKAPALADRAAPSAVTDEPRRKQPPALEHEALVIARQLICTVDVAGARRLLAAEDLAQHGEARFMLAETYDPNVLAALGLTGVMAEASTALRHYEAARTLGIEAAARRLEQLR